ncbi:aspartic peptidase domain-containing protein [Lactifluus subvellereus]|nr:aspartic peptidase domain-containing protein [Lactifluus subvellereus]
MLLSIVVSLLFFPSLSVAAASPPPRREPLHIPVLRRRHEPRDGDAVLDHYANLAANLRGKYNYGPPVSRRARAKTSTVDITITNHGSDSSYFAPVSVGTPPQTLDLILDTGTSDLWFVTTDCLDCGQGTKLDLTKSTSLQLYKDQPPVILLTPTGNAWGTAAQDTVSMGPFTVKRQIFVAVNSVSDTLINGKLAGLMGLAFQGIADIGAVPFWQALLNNSLTNPEFSFFLTRFVNNPNAKTEEPGGVFTLGGTNTTLFQGNIDFQSFTPPPGGGSLWLQTISSVTVNGKKVDIGNTTTAAIDTGTTLIGGPTAAVNAIWSAVPNSVPSTNMSGFFTFPCNTQLTISISFGGPSWPINVTDLNLGTVGDGQCLGGIFDVTGAWTINLRAGHPDWIIGDTFLKNVYTVFRAKPPAVGFAQLSAAAGGSGS